jgi:guanylate kinase
MLEHKTVFSNMYGTSKKSVESIADEGKIPVLDVDVEGMLDICKSLS